MKAHIDALLQTARERVDEARDGGGKVVGYYPGGYVPKELLYASGAIPLCLANGGDARIADEALSLLPNVICPFARAQVGQMLLKADPFYTGLDLLVVPSTCQHMKKIGDVWEYYEGCPVFKLGIPCEHDKPFELEYFQSRLLDLTKRLECVTGRTITDDRLYDAIELYNRLRRLLKTLSLARRGPGPRLSALDFVLLNHASFYVDPVLMIDGRHRRHRFLRSGQLPVRLQGESNCHKHGCEQLQACRFGYLLPHGRWNCHGLPSRRRDYRQGVPVEVRHSCGIPPVAFLWRLRRISPLHGRRRGQY